MNKKDFALRHPQLIGEDSFRKYAVLVPLIEHNGEPYVIFEKRSDQLRKHPGEICFPGGKLEAGETLEECAIRETMEELLIEKEKIHVCGPGDIYLSPFNLILHPFLAEIKDYTGTYGTDEVEEIIKIPLSFFQTHEPEKFETALVNEPPKDFPYDRIPGGTNYHWVKGTHVLLFYQYEEWIIWGMTAQIIKSMVQLISDYQML